MKRIILITSIFASLMASFSVANASGEQICTQSYGQPVVCTTKTPAPVHTPVQAGIEDINPAVVGFLALGLGSFVYLKTKKASLS